MYLRTKFQGSSIILTSFRQGVILPEPLPPPNESLKSPPRLRLKDTIEILWYRGQRKNLHQFFQFKGNCMNVVSLLIFWRYFNIMTFDRFLWCSINVATYSVSGENLIFFQQNKSLKLLIIILLIIILLWLQEDYNFQQLTVICQELKTVYCQIWYPPRHAGSPLK